MDKAERYVVGECELAEGVEGVAVFDMADDGPPFCLVDPCTCLGGMKGAFARAQDIAGTFNVIESRSTPQGHCS